MQTLQYVHLKDELIDKNTSLDRVVEILLQIRKSCSVEQSPPLQQMIDSNIMPAVIQIYESQLDITDTSRVDILWIITNLASGSQKQAEYVVQQGGLQLLVSQIGHANQAIVEQAIWGIGNIAGDGYQLRNLLLNQYDVVQMLCKTIDNWEGQEIQDSTKHNFAWAMSNLARGKPKPDFQKVKDMIPYFINFLNPEKYQYNVDLVTDSLWALSYASDNEDNVILDLLEYNIISIVKPYLNDTNISIIIPALRILGNIATGSDTCVDALIKEEVPSKFVELTQNEKKNIRKECFWSLSNITAGTQDQVKYICDVPNFLEYTYKAIEKEIQEVQQEAMWTLANLMTCKDVNSITKAISSNTNNSVFKGVRFAMDNKKIQRIFIEYLELLSNHMVEQQESINEQNKQLLQQQFQYLVQQEWFLNLVSDESLDQEIFMSILTNLQQYFNNFNDIQSVCTDMLSSLGDIEQENEDSLNEEMEQQIQDLNIEANPNPNPNPEPYNQDDEQQLQQGIEAIQLAAGAADAAGAAGAAGYNF